MPTSLAMESGVARWSRAQAADALAWQIDAGADIAVADQAGSWLQTATPAAIRTDRETSPENSGFQPVSPTPSGTATDSTCVVEGEPGSPVVLLLPIEARSTQQGIITGPEAILLQRMMAAIGIQPEQVIRVGLTAASLASSLHTQNMLAGAKACLVLGDGPSKTILGKAAGQMRGQVHQIDIGGGSLPATATFAPQFLLRQPRMKALAWADLRLFASLLAR